MKKVIIVGAGIVGATTAFELAKRNYDVTIVDSFERGRATSAAAGIICPWISQRRNKSWYQLASDGAAFLEKLVLDLKRHGVTKTGYKKVGTLRIHPDRTRLEKVHDIVTKRRLTNPQIGDIKLLSKEETNDMFPLLADHYYSLFISGGARVDGRALREGLLEAAIGLGATFVSGKASLFIEDGNPTGVKVIKNDDALSTLAAQKIDADKIILTNGMWMPELLSPLDLHLHVTIQKGEIVHLQTDTDKTNDLPVVMAPYDQYILSFADGKMVIGATRENKPKNTNKTIGGLNTILNRALEVAPALAESSLVETRIGIRPFTANHLPVFGKVPHFNQLYLANGLGSSGLSTGPLIGLQLAKMIAHEEADVDWELYRVDQALK